MSKIRTKVTARTGAWTPAKAAEVRVDKVVSPIVEVKPAPTSADLAIPPFLKRDPKPAPSPAVVKSALGKMVAAIKTVPGPKVPAIEAPATDAPKAIPAMKGGGVVGAVTRETAKREAAIDAEARKPVPAKHGRRPNGTILPLTPKPKGKPAKAKPAPKASKVKASPKPASKPARATASSGKTKTALIGELLTRKGGCTRADVLEATGWPSVSMPQQAKALGLTLTTKKDGSVNRYHGK